MKLWFRSLLLASCWQLSGVAIASAEIKATTLTLAVDQAPRLRKFFGCDATALCLKIAI